MLIGSPNTKGRAVPSMNPFNRGLHRWRTSLPIVMSMVVLVSLGDVRASRPMASLPSNAARFVPPAAYQQWWTRTVACSGLRGSLPSIEWFVVPGAATFDTNDGARVARWSRGKDGTRIVLAGAYLSDEMVVRHEMLHALLDRPDHPPEYFVDRCHLTWESWGG